MRLVQGAGSEKTGACWMSALHWYTRHGTSWTDQPQCVSPVIRRLCIRLNDACSDGEREALIGPHLFAPVGTNTGHADDIKRAYLCADRAVRVFAPIALDRAGQLAAAATLRALQPITDQETARSAHKAADAADAADAAAYAADAAAAAYYAAAYYAADAKSALLQLILDCCAIGTQAEVCEAKTRDAVLAYLEK